jgi:hypothetical protein
MYGSTPTGATSLYGAPTARLDIPNGQPETNPQGRPQGPSYGSIPQANRPQGPTYGQNPQALAAALSAMAPQMGNQVHAMPDGSVMPNSAMPAQMPALVSSPMMPPMQTAMPMMGKPIDPMAAQRLRDRQMAGVNQ